MDILLKLYVSGIMYKGGPRLNGANLKSNFECFILGSVILLKLSNCNSGFCRKFVRHRYLAVLLNLSRASKTIWLGKWMNTSLQNTKSAFLISSLQMSPISSFQPFSLKAGQVALSQES